MPIRKRYGCRPDHKDSRDLKFRAARAPILPPSVDLRHHCIPTLDQGDLGACTAHAITAVLRWHVRRGGGPDVPLSRLQLYYDERVIEKTVGLDDGAQIRNGIKSARTKGVGHEDLWPYDVAKFKELPPPVAYQNADMFGGLTYERVPVSAWGLKSALALGFPVVIGVNLYESFESTEVEKTGMVPMPAVLNGEVSEADAGGHCMYVAGYGQRPGTFTVHNSWGDDWGDRGFCYMPESYLGSPVFGSDYWVVKNLVG